MKFKIAILGATGYIGEPYRREIRECADDAEIVALCARRMPRLRAAGAEDNAQRITNDWREAISHEDVNLVLVLTPDSLHYEAVMAAADRGLHVVCEKPVGLNVAEAAAMWAAYQQNSLGHFVPFWSRYVEAFRRAREIVQSGRLGEIRAFVYRWHNPRPAAIPFTWRDDAAFSSAGSIADVGSHAYDTLRWMLGQNAKRVITHGDMISPDKPDLGPMDLAEAIAWGNEHTRVDAAASKQATAFDYANIAIEMENGMVGAIILSHSPFLRKGLAPELELHGEDASLSVERIHGNLRLFRADADPETVATLPDLGLGNRFRHFVFPALRQRMAGEPCDHPGLDDGLAVQQFTDSAALSAGEGRWVVLGNS